MKFTVFSLTRRLVLRLTIVLLVAIGLAASAVGWRAMVAVRGLDDTPLQIEAGAIANGLGREPEGQLQLRLPPGLSTLFASPDGPSGYIVADGAGKPVLASSQFMIGAVSGVLPAHPGLFRVPGSRLYPTGLVGYAMDSGKWRIFVLQRREQVEALSRSLLAEFLSTVLLLLAAIGLGAIGLAAWTVRQGLAPARAASSAAAAIGPSRPGMRLPELGQPAEIAPLVRAVNQAVSRLEGALTMQRRFVGDAAHTLRTPLAVLTARLDALSESDTKTALLGDADRMARLVGQMLHMARIEGASLDLSAEVDLREVAIEVIGTLAPLAVRRRVELSLSAEDQLVRMQGNRSTLVVAVQNLIENAINYTPAEKTVEIVIGPTCLSVADRGPGVPETERNLIFQRFQRGVQAPSGGAGLGLAIVAEIAAAHGGSVEVAAREGGGSVFTLRLNENFT